MALARRLVPRVTCVVLSGLVSFALGVAEELAVPSFVLWGTSACGFLCTLRLRQLRQRGYTPLKGPSSSFARHKSYIKIEMFEFLCVSWDVQTRAT